MKDALKKANNYLKLAECRLVIEQRGVVFYLRGYLPDKATGAGLKQQRMSTGLSATPAGLKEAISLALRVNAELQAGQMKLSHLGYARWECPMLISNYPESKDHTDKPSF